MSLEIFQWVAEEEIAYYELIVVAMLNLCELVPFESKTFGETGSLQEAKVWVEKPYS